MPSIDEIEPDARSVDGNSVVGEREASRLNENAVMYQAVAQGVGKHLAMLRFAASDGKL
jgi:flagellar basal body rod protein FlgB